MKAWVKKQLVNLKVAAGIKINILPDGGHIYTLCILEYNKGVVNITERKETINEISELATYLTEKIPVFLLVEGKGVLHKVIEEGQNLSTEVLLRKVFPNAKQEDFYLQTVEGNQKHFVSVVRKTTIDEIREIFLSNNISLTHISLGPFIIQDMSRLLGLENASIQNGDHILFLQSYELKGYENNTASQSEVVSYEIGDDKVAAAILPAYAAALGLFVNGKDFKRHTLSLETPLVDEWEQKRIFQNSSKLILLSVFIILLVNAFFYFHFNGINQQLSAQYAVHSNVLVKFNKLSMEVEEQQIFLEKIGWEKNSKISFYADRLAATLPEEISWTDLQIYPMDEKLFKKQKEQIFQNDIIFLQGKCQGPMALNNWLVMLEKLDWITEINNQTYNYNEREKTGVFSFNITIQ